jgi:hypothetical protein
MSDRSLFRGIGKYHGRAVASLTEQKAEIQPELLAHLAASRLGTYWSNRKLCEVLNEPAGQA